MSTNTTERDEPWLIRTYSGHSSAAASNALYRTNLPARPDRPLRRLRPADPDRLRQRPRARQGRGRQGRRAGGASGRHARALRRHSAGADEHLDDDQRHRRPGCSSLYIAAAEAQGAARRDLAGTTQNDIIKEYLSRGTYIFPPGPSLKLTADVIAFTYRELPKWNPIERLLLPPAGGGRDAGTGAGLRARHRRGGARRGATLGPGARGGLPAGGRPHQLLRQCRHPLHHRDVQDARLRRAVGRDHAASATASTEEKYRRFRYGVQVNSLGLTEQQPENNVYRILLGDAGGGAVEERARARRAAAGLERGAGPAAALGPAMVACACSRSSPTRPTCWNTATSSTAPPRSRARSTRLKRDTAAELERIRDWAARWRRSKAAI